MLKRYGICAAIVAGLLGTAACYNPNIAPGGLQCATGGAKECPDGFMCQSGVCIKVGAVGGGGATGSGGHMGSGGAMGSGGTGGGIVRPPRQEGETCLLMQDKTHDCVTGLLCIDDCSNASRCYRPCQGDGDCAQSSCRQATADTPRVCELPYTMCTPTDMNGGGCGTGRQCLLLSSQPAPAGGDRTVCDCSRGQSGTGEPCNETRECFAGLVCPSVGSPGEGFCRRVCDPTAGAAICGATTCRPYGAKWGYCYL